VEPRIVRCEWYNIAIMVRIQIQLQPSQHRQVRQRARRMGVSVSEVIRRCVDGQLRADGCNSPTIQPAAPWLSPGSTADPRGDTTIAPATMRPWRKRSGDERLHRYGRPSTRIWSRPDASHAAVRAAFCAPARRASAALDDLVCGRRDDGAPAAPHRACPRPRDFDEEVLAPVRVRWVDEALYRLGTDRLWREDRRHVSLVDATSLEFMRSEGLRRRSPSIRISRMRDSGSCPARDWPYSGLRAGSAPAPEPVTTDNGELRTGNWELPTSPRLFLMNDCCSV